MGLYDDITPDTLRADLRYFAELILRLDAENRLLEATPRLLKVLGDLRAKIFAYEVRSTGHLLPKPEEAAPEGEADGDSRRIVEESIRRIEEAAQEWDRPFDPDPPPE